MHPRFVLEGAVYFFAVDFDAYLFVAAQGALRCRQDGVFPAFLVQKTGVHAEQVCSKQTGFVAPRSRPNLQNGILRIFRVLGNQHFLDFRLQLFDLRHQGIQLVLGHGLQLRVFLRLEQGSRLVLVVQQTEVDSASLYQRQQGFVFPVEPYRTRRVCGDFRLHQQIVYFVVPLGQRMELVNKTHPP